MPTDNRNIRLNILPLTTCKKVFLNTLFNSYNLACADVLEYWKSNKGITQTQLHHATYKDMRKKYKLPADYTISSRVMAWNRRKIANKIHKVPIRLTTKLFTYDTTDRDNPVLAITSFTRNRVVLPIKQDGAFTRFQDLKNKDYTFKSILLIKRHNRFFLQMVMQKKFEKPIDRPNTIGVDVGSANLAAISVLDSKGNILRQLYFGRDVANKQRMISKRRSKLQSKADNGYKRAIKSLRRLKRYQSNFIDNRSWEVAHKIMDLALEFNANIKVEDLSIRVNKKKGKSFGKKVNGKINRIPYGKLFHALDCLSIHNRVKIIKIDPRNTSRTCYKCGHAGKDNWEGYSLFKCTKCNHTVHRDRNASVNIALANPVSERTKRRVLTTTSVQTSETGASVTKPVCVHDVEMVIDDVHLAVSPEAKSPRL